MSRWRRVAVVTALLVGVPLVLVIAAFAAGLSIDASRWREAAAQQASTALGRPVVLRGALQLRLGRDLQLRIGDVHVLNAPGFKAPTLLSIGEARLSLQLRDLLPGPPRLRRIEADDIVLSIERAADGRDNWSAAQPRDAAVPQPAIDLGHITLRRLVVRYHDASAATTRNFELDELEGTASAQEPLRLALRGRLQGQFSYLLRVEGAGLTGLIQGTQPWPFTLDFKAAGARLHAGGAVDPRQREVRFRFDADTDDLAQIGRLVDASLPDVGALVLHGSVVARADAVAMSALQGRVGESELSGQLALRWNGARAGLSGALSLSTFDLSSWQVPGNAAEGAAPDWQAMALRNIVPLDLDLELHVGRWLGLPVGLLDTTLSLRADAHGVQAPVSASLAGARVSGRLDLDTAAPTPAFALDLHAQDLMLGDLLRQLAGADNIEGRVGQVRLGWAGRGATVGALARDLVLSLDLTAGQARIAAAGAARPITVKLDVASFVAGADQRLRGQARGTLMGERVRLSLLGGTGAELWSGRAMPLELELALASATLRLQSAFDPAGGLTASDLRFDFRALRSGDLARWLPVDRQSQLPVALRGRLHLSQQAWQLEAATLELGRTELHIDARRTLASERPLTTATLRGRMIDVTELATLRAGDGPGIGLDTPFLAGAIELGDADLEIDLQHLRLGGTDLTDVAAVARLREGRLLPSTFSGRLAGAPFSALLELDLRGEMPLAALDLSTGAIDLGVLLRGLGVAEDVDGQAQSLQLTLRGRGNSLQELAANTSLDAWLVGGSLTVLGPAQRPVTEIRLREAFIGAAAGQPLRLRLDGTLDQTDVRIRLSTATLAAFAGGATRMPFSMAAQAAGARLSLDGEVRLPLGSQAWLNFQMSGERLDTLSELAQVELPAWGPWSLRGPIRMTSSGYEVPGLTLAVGQSRLSGSGTLDLGAARPRLQLQVAAPSIQLDDFPMPTRLSDPAEPPRQGDGMRAAASRTAGRIDRLLSARFLRRFDATVDVQASEVLSGADRLADGVLRLKLQEGRLDLDPALVNLPGGSMRLTMAYDLKESEVDFQLAANVERFDYGIIARRLNRADDLRGLFSLNMQLSGRAPSLDTIMRNANGQLDIAVWPTELRSGMFNLWSANLVLTLLPLIDPGLKSQVNCIVARVDLKQGDLSDDKIVIDTSTVRIRGEGHANLGTEELAMVFRPRAKGLGLFRLQTPLRVSGTLTDQRFHFDQQDVFFSVLRLIASPILVPIEWFTLGAQPRDGADICTQPLRAISP